MGDSKLYTGYGDRGYTQTVHNKHIAKSDDLIHLLGTLDEFTSSLGVAKAQLHDKALYSDIEAVQKKMVGLMGELAGGEPSVTEACVRAVEELTDKYQPRGFSGFTLPGKNLVSAQLDLARTVVRRAERIAAKLLPMGKIRGVTFTYLNRLSDLTYAFACYAAEERRPQIPAASESAEALTLGLAKEIALAVEKRAEELGKQVVVAIVDGGGTLMLLHAMPNAFIASRQIAQDKAYTAVSLKMPTHVALAESRGGTLDGLTPTDSNKLMLLGGGEPLIIGGNVAGGLGVSGGTAEEDIAFARFGAMYLEGRLNL